jgi:ectoine hydroxylase-related dioxygenase (phytanoyl-CoA dioxygenase family)
MLSTAEVLQYKASGYLIPPYRLPTGLLQSMREALGDLLKNNPGVRPEKLVSAHIVHRAGAIDNGEGVRGDRRFFSLANTQEILTMVQQLIGPDVVLWGCHVFCKPQGDGQLTPWHQDGHYWPIRPLATCTVWVALDDSTIENGCLRVIPGSHSAALTYPHLHEDRTDLVLSDRTDESSFDEARAVNIELQAGQMSIHDVHLIHGAARNTSNKRRAGVALRYMPASSVFERTINPADGKSGVPVAFSERPIWLLCGTDKSGRNDFKVGHAPADQQG